MTDGFDIARDLEDAQMRVAECINDMHELGFKRAEAERVYRIAKRKKILMEREQNHTPVTIIADIVKGSPDIAQLAFERDCAETEYLSNYEAILFWKKRTDVLREQWNREWGNQA